MNGEPTHDPGGGPYGRASETPPEQDATGYSPGEALPQAPAAPTRPPGSGWWTYWDLLYLLLFSVPALLLITVVCTAALFGLSFLSGWEVDIEAPQVKAPLAIAIQLLLWVAVFAFIYAVVTIKYGLAFGPAIGWTSYSGRGPYYLYSGVALAIAVALISTLLPKPEGEVPFEALLKDPVSIALLAIFGVLVAPVVEEMLFRGFIFSVVDRSLGAAAAVVSTSLLFSLPHGVQYGWRWQNLLLLTPLGVAFGTVRAWTGSVRPSALMHASYNATLFAGLLFAGEHVEKL